MPRKSKTSDPEKLRQDLVELLGDLPNRLAHGSTSEQVCELVRAHHILRDLGATIGSSLAPGSERSGRARLLAYFRLQVGQIVHTDELMIVAGIGDYPRRIRELRKAGWPIISGSAVSDIRRELLSLPSKRTELPPIMAPEEYVLVEDARDMLAVDRWKLAKSIHGSQLNPIERLRSYLRQTIGQRISADELKFASGNDPEWAVHLRTLVHGGLAVRSWANGHDVPMGIFILEN